MTAAVRRLTPDQETSLPEHDELLALACAKHDAIVAKAFLQDEAGLRSKRSLRHLRDTALAAFRDKLSITSEGLRRTMQCHNGACNAPHIAAMLNTLRQAQHRVDELLSGVHALPMLSVPTPVEYVDCEVMKPLHDSGTGRAQGRKRIAAYVDLAITMRRVTAVTVAFPNFISPLRGRPAPDLFTSQSSQLDRAMDSARQLIEALPAWTVASRHDHQIWISVRSQPILIGEAVQELKFLRDRMQEDQVHGHAGVVGPMTDVARRLIEDEGFLAFDPSELHGIDLDPLRSLARQLPCDLSALPRAENVEQHHAIAA